MDTHNEYNALHIQRKLLMGISIFVREKQQRIYFFSSKSRATLKMTPSLKKKSASKVKHRGICIQLGYTYKYIFTHWTIPSCAKVRCHLGHHSAPLLILHDQRFTSSKFHSSSLQRLCFKQELAGHIIARKRCDLLWGKLRLIMIKCSGFLCVSGSDFVFKAVRIH